MTITSAGATNSIKIPVTTIRKFDKKGFRMLKNLCKEFMKSQRTEHLVHQARQLELLEEQQDDMFEFDEKII